MARISYRGVRRRRRSRRRGIVGRIIRSAKRFVRRHRRKFIGIRR